MSNLLASSITLALQHIERFGDTDIFPYPFEFDAIKYFVNTTESKEFKYDVTKFLSSALENYKFGQYRRLFVPKKRNYGYRLATQLDPLDSIIYTALVFELGNELEASRIPRNDNIILSNRFEIGSNGEMYSNNFSYNHFIEIQKNQFITDKTTHVLIVDIADFYNRIYLHPLENQLNRIFNGTDKEAKAKFLIKLLKHTNANVSYGIPVGQAASHILAEVSLNSIDNALLSEGYSFCRYFDDYRIFCKDIKSAYKALEYITELLYESHGLTIQESKTEIVTKEIFLENYLNTDHDLEIDNLNEIINKFKEDKVKEIPYATIEDIELDDEELEELKNLNLISLLKDEVQSPSPKYKFINFLLSRLHFLNEKDDIESTINTLILHIDNLLPSIPYIVKYLDHIHQYLSDEDAHSIADAIINITLENIAGSSNYNQVMFFDLIKDAKVWNNSLKINTILATNRLHPMVERKLILQQGNDQNYSWFETRRRNVFSYEAWTKRAFMYSARCLIGDQFDHWQKSLMSSDLSILEQIVLAYALKNRS